MNIIIPNSKSELVNVIIQMFENNITDLNCIDTSKITDMSNLFSIIFEIKSSYQKNMSIIDISKWNVSNVKNMAHMFDGVQNFNCDISNWNVSNLINGFYMFYGCKNFTGKGLEKWNLKNCKNMGYMFAGCKKFNCNVGNWNCINVENLTCTFAGCHKFIGDGIEKWYTPNLKEVDLMFDECYVFDENVSGIDISNIKEIHGMFQCCKKFTGKGIENWNVSNLIKASYMFSQCKLFNGDLSNWDVSNIKDLTGMFQYCYKFTGNGLENWNTSSFESLNGTFSNCVSLSCDLSNWNLSNIKIVSYVFYECKKLDFDISKWNIEKFTLDKRFEAIKGSKLKIKDKM